MFRSDIVKWRSMVEAINLKPDWAASKHPNAGWHIMSAFGPKQTSLFALHMSAFRGKADMTFCGAHVCFWPKATLLARQTPRIRAVLRRRPNIATF